MKLYDRVRDYYETQCRKHELAPVSAAYATDQINKMTNDEFLAVISEALAEALGSE